MRARLWRLAPWLAAPLAVGLLTLLARLAGANATAAGVLYLVLVVGLAAWGGWLAGVVASLAATVCLDVFFLRPFGRLTIAASGDVAALVSFLVAAVLAGRLMARARRQAEEADVRRREVLALAGERERLLAASAHLAAVRASDALKTSLLRAVSHDLRTPLTAMQLGLEGLSRYVQGNPEAEAGLRDVAREQERLTRRIDNLLALARLEAGVARPHPEDVQAGALFRSARESLARVLAERPVEVRVDRACPDLWIDPSLAVEIVVNLLENAARAAPPHLPLELAAGPDPDDATSIRLEVLDRGPGLPLEERRAGGLGLLIASGLAAANGGTLALLDRAGGGTIARLILPAAPTLGEESP